ncbi:hypothetical protein [Corynebacterium sp.]|uniref:hypothetical protein n=1 Tax=Corynebacterium sp. TaxID=1720 RepID=UPI0026DB6479|nr:hypothetical protein [Corynebacterium sp.]MDO5075916.1 hypothetical protein [Corynebacterium sp.]
MINPFHAARVSTPAPAASANPAPPRIQFPWWANPTVLMLLSLSVVAYVVMFVGPRQYERWKTAQHVMPADGPIVLGIIVAALCGVLIAWRVRMRPVAETNFLEYTQRFLQTRLAAMFLYGFFALTVVGYALWIFFAARNGLSFDTVLNVLQGDPGAISELKRQAQPTAGLTTFTQCGTIVAVLGVARSRLAGRPARLLVGVVIALSLLRFLFYAERIAFLEVVVPAVILMVALVPARVRWPRARTAAIRLFPVVSVVLIFGLFALGEYFRSWAFVRQDTDQTFFGYIFSRFLSYYATATNNGALYGRIANEKNIQHTAFYSFYNFPGEPFGVDTVDGTPFDQWWAMQLETSANPSLTNIGTVFPLVGELSLVTMLLVFFVVAFITTLLFRQARRGHLLSLLTVPILCFAFLELPRISYLTLGRVVPMALGLLAIWFAYDLWRAWTLQTGQATELSDASAPQDSPREAAEQERHHQLPQGHRYHVAMKQYYELT